MCLCLLLNANIDLPHSCLAQYTTQLWWRKHLRRFFLLVPTSTRVDTAIVVLYELLLLLLLLLLWYWPHETTQGQAQSQTSIVRLQYRFLLGLCSASTHKDQMAIQALPNAPLQPRTMELTRIQDVHFAREPWRHTCQWCSCASREADRFLLHPSSFPSCPQETTDKPAAQVVLKSISAQGHNTKDSGINTGSGHRRRPGCYLSAKKRR